MSSSGPSSPSPAPPGILAPKAWSDSIRDGAALCTGLADVEARVELRQRSLDLPPARKPKLAAEPSKVLAALADGACHVDELVRRTQLPAARVQVALIQLSVAGRARQDGGVWHAA